jgi:RimJ/RimL family protein N-acetyltransferase
LHRLSLEGIEGQLTPVLETERLRLRAHKASDFSSCLAMWSDPVILRYTIREPSPPPRTWQRLLAYRGHWEIMGHGYWAVEEKTSQRYIGELGFADFKRDVHTSIEGLPEIGWSLISAAHGKGYATEALRAAIAWGDAYLDCTQTVCIIHRENHRSLRVAEKLGYNLVLKAASEEEPDNILVRHKARKRV